MRIGIFGGTFDPIHVGHLILAERCREDAGLDEVWFLPSYKPPHKSDRELTRFDQRCEMVPPLFYCLLIYACTALTIIMCESGQFCVGHTPYTDLHV